MGKLYKYIYQIKVFDHYFELNRPIFSNGEQCSYPLIWKLVRGNS